MCTLVLCNNLLTKFITGILDIPVPMLGPELISLQMLQGGAPGMVRPAGLPLRVLSHGRPLLSSRAVAAAVTITVLTVNANADLCPGLAVAAPRGAEEVARTTTRMHSDWPSQMPQAAHFQP